MYIDLEKYEAYITDSELAKNNSKGFTNLLDIANASLCKENSTISAIEELPKNCDARRFRIAPRGTWLDHRKDETIVDDQETKLLVNDKEVTLMDGDKYLGPIRNLLNYAAKTVKNFDLTSADMSFTLEDIKYEVSVTR